ncbi:hypothetical protein HPB52_024245 [Rhipicephalus sanguineus]|uniref:Uncharacterized protein n=1 Tax=Rhipicephalus sanguineus TaxID=34632 RepID=A0A9D4TCI3_RHISA|nr:hypothetical protein HPB52_024245 [Rhipicephalus sanguineus]
MHPGGPWVAGSGGGLAAAAGPAGVLSYAAILGSGARPGAPGAAQPVPLGPDTAGGPGIALRHDHVAFLTLVGTTEAPARDVVRLLKTNIDPAAKGINDVTLRYTRYGVTVFSNTRQSLVNMRTAIEENTVTRAALTVRVPEKRNPHVRFCGVDPDIGADEFLRLLRDRNPSFQLNLETPGGDHGVRGRSGPGCVPANYGVPAIIHRVDGCTSTRGPPRNDLHLLCVLWSRSQYLPLMERASQSDVHEVEGDAAVCCAACRRAGMEAAGHPAGHPQCPLLMDKVAWLPTGALCDRMLHDTLHLAAASDPYMPSKPVPRLPAGFAVISVREDPRVIIIIRQPTFDVCYTWEVLDDITYSEHRNIVVRIGNTAARPRNRLTRFAQAELIRALAQDSWFHRVVGSDLGSPTALDTVLEGFYKTYSSHVKRHLRPVKSSAGGNSWWPPWLAEEKRRVNASLRRFQRYRNDDFRAVFRVNYNAALAGYRTHIRQAKEEFEAECNSACSRHSVFRHPSEKRLIAIDDPTKDLPEHAHVRAMAASPYTTFTPYVPFTTGEVRQVIDRISPRSAPGPDDITPTIVKGLFAVQPEFVMFLMNSALKLGYFPRLWRRGRIIFIHKPNRPPEKTTSYRQYV